MHVLIALIKVDPQFVGSGISRAVADRCRILIEQGHGVTVAASFDDSPPRAPCAGVALVHVPLRRRAPQFIPGLNDALHGRAIGGAIQAGRIAGPVDLVDVQEAGIARGVYDAAKSAGWAIVHSIHLSALYGRPRFGAIRQRMLAKANVWAARNADHCIAVSECVRDAYVSAGIPADRLSVVYNPVRLPEAAGRSTSPPPADVQVLWLGRMVEGKGVEEAVAVAESMSAGPEGPRFLFVGGGPLENLARGAAARNGRIRCAGVVRDASELDRLRAESDAFLATSVHETFGLAVAEAMAAGLPVLASDIPAHREILGGAGLFYPVGDGAALAGCLKRLTTSMEERASRGTACRARAEALFGRQTACARLVSAYASALAAKGGGDAAP